MPLKKAVDFDFEFEFGGQFSLATATAYSLHDSCSKST